jgi:membrane protein DedA with SNARE-associated domain
VEALTEFITDFIFKYGYVAVFVLMVLESACIPIPSEVTMLFGGALANPTFAATAGSVPHEPLNFLLVGLVGTLGNLVGSWLAYWVGLRGGRPLIERWGRYVFIREHELDRAEAWFAAHGEAAVFAARLLPVVRTFISLPAGVAEMPFVKFTIYTFAGCLPWTFALAGVGYAVGAQWETVERYLRPISIAVAVVIVVAAAWWLVRRARARKSETEVSSEQ